MKLKTHCTNYSHPLPRNDNYNRCPKNISIIHILFGKRSKNIWKWVSVISAPIQLYYPLDHMILKMSISSIIYEERNLEIDISAQIMHPFSTLGYWSEHLQNMPYKILKQIEILESNNHSDRLFYTVCLLFNVSLGALIRTCKYMKRLLIDNIGRRSTWINATSRV